MIFNLVLQGRKRFNFARLKQSATKDVPVLVKWVGAHSTEPPIALEVEIRVVRIVHLPANTQMPIQVFRGVLRVTRHYVPLLIVEHLRVKAEVVAERYHVRVLALHERLPITIELIVRQFRLGAGSRGVPWQLPRYLPPLLSTQVFLGVMKHVDDHVLLGVQVFRKNMNPRYELLLTSQQRSRPAFRLALVLYSQTPLSRINTRVDRLHDWPIMIRFDKGPYGLREEVRLHQHHLREMNVV